MIKTRAHYCNWDDSQNRKWSYSIVNGFMFRNPSHLTFHAEKSLDLCAVTCFYFPLAETNTVFITWPWLTQMWSEESVSKQMPLRSRKISLLSIFKENRRMLVMQNNNRIQRTRKKNIKHLPKPPKGSGLGVSFGTRQVKLITNEHCCQLGDRNVPRMTPRGPCWYTIVFIWLKCISEYNITG